MNTSERIALLPSLLRALFQDGLLGDVHEDEYAGNGSSVYNTSVEGVARDLFYEARDIPQKFSEAISTSAQAAALAKEYAPDKAQVCFYAEDFDQGGEVYLYEVWVTNADKGWLLKMEGNMGSYCDENYDASASYDINVNCSKEDILTQVHQKHLQLGRSLVIAAEKQAKTSLQNVGDAFRAQAQESVQAGMINVPFFAPVKAQQQKQIIADNVKQTSASSSVAPSKKM